MTRRILIFVTAWFFLVVAIGAATSAAQYAERSAVIEQEG